MAHELPASLPGRGRRTGSITLLALCMTTVLGIALGGYLALCSRSAQFSGRVLGREKAQQLAQTGIEEALWALNQDTWTSSGPDGTSAWTTSGADRTVTLSYTLPGTGLTGQVVITISNYASTGPTWPTITSRATVTLQGGQTYAESLQAATTPAPLFGNAIASSDSYVSFVAGGTVDSWNSDPDANPATAAVAYSFTAGNATNYAAVIAARGNSTSGVQLTQATVRGYVTTFGLPVSYSTSGSPTASVVGPSSTAGSVDGGRLGKSAFIPTTSSVFAVSTPATNGANFGGLVNNAVALVSALTGASASIDTYKTSGDLTITGLLLVAPSLTFSRPTKLIVDGNLTLSDTGQITVTSTGSLEIFVNGSVTIGGLGLNNQTKEPKNLAIFYTGATSSSAITYTTNADFCGVIYGDSKPIDIQQNATFYGALLSRSYVRFSGSATAPVFHYDLALRQVRFAGVTTPYLVKSITEI